MYDVLYYYLSIVNVLVIQWVGCFLGDSEATHSESEKI